jgi:Ribbon-helix-helix domain
MPISLRLDDALGDQLDRASAALGIPKSALIRRGIEEVLRTVSAPSAHALYVQTLPTSVEGRGAGASRSSNEARAHKLAFRQAMAKKQTDRKTRASVGASGSVRGRAAKLS